MFSLNSDSDPNLPIGIVLLHGYCNSGSHQCNPGPDLQSLRWSQTVNYGFIPNPVLENCFMSNAYQVIFKK